ncbi:MAG: hypothetical protein COW08_06085 [Ignavibacteriales bacterium CG12_big_fil_rev_8_21_14_0_65_30_8]|nr:MAG: hypothetical protein COW08_06085 [Ignavibacteriales bacterium CG12_big_fil_rev_8_21_14_0_65_30_8]
MKEDKENLSQLKKAVSSDFYNYKEFSLLPEADLNTLEEFKIYLTEKISELMVINFDGLLKILYQIDINEIKIKNVIHSTNDYKAPLIADLIIKRQLQKIETRKKYKENKNRNILS